MHCHTGIGAPKRSMAQTTAREAAGTAVASGRAVPRREAIKTPPAEVRRNTATWSSFRPLTSFAGVAAFRLQPTLGVRTTSWWRRTGVSLTQQDSRGDVVRSARRRGRGSDHRRRRDRRQERLLEGKRRDAAACLPSRWCFAKPALGLATPRRRRREGPRRRWRGGGGGRRSRSEGRRGAGGGS